MRTLLAPTPHGMAIADDERAFFIALGQRIATQRKAQGITQVDLAERLGISQQAMNSFEKGRRRVPVSLLPLIAQTLDTTLDALVAHDATADRVAAAGQAAGYRAGVGLGNRGASVAAQPAKTKSTQQWEMPLRAGKETRFSAPALRKLERLLHSRNAAETLIAELKCK